MSGGYTPLFSSLTTGTLCGRWPDIGLWPIVLSMCDRHGVVDVTPDYLSRVTGLPLQEVVGCMKRFCQPDPYSRSGLESGARLVLLESHRDWGWRIVNHGAYREKARKQMQQVEATESGRDADRKRVQRERKPSSGVQPRPAVSSADRLSDSDSDSDSDSEKNSEKILEPRSVELKLDRGPVDRVFNHWRTEFRHPKAVLDPKRRKTIQRALEAYDEDTLKASISGYLLSPHHMGQNEQRAVYDDISLFLRGAEHIERGLNCARAPPVRAMSAVEVAQQNLRKSRNGNGSVVAEQDGSREGYLVTVGGVLR